MKEKIDHEQEDERLVQRSVRHVGTERSNMSADDGTYILQTYGPEYRIVYAHAIDNIYGQYDDENHNWFPNVKGIIDYFGKSDVYSTIEEAWDAAYTIDEKNGWSELGTCLITEFCEYHFTDFEERYAQEN